MKILFDLLRGLRAFALGVFATAMFVASSSSFAIGTTYTCSEQQRSLIEVARGGAGASCIGKPYQLVCTDNGDYGCCKSACECIFRGRLYADKGWGGGARNLTSYSLSNSCPIVKDPSMAAPGTLAPARSAPASAPASPSTLAPLPPRK